MEPLIKHPWCFETKKCTQEQWEVIREYRLKVAGKPEDWGHYDISSYGYELIGIETNCNPNIYHSVEDFGSNTKLYEPQEIVDIIQGKTSENEVVNCTTQEEWDFVLRVFNPRRLESINFSNDYKKDSCICIKTSKFIVGNYADKQFYAANNHKILSFSEWCTKYGHTNPFEKKVLEDEVIYCVTSSYDKDNQFLFKYGSANFIDVKDKIFTHYIFEHNDDYIYTKANPTQIKHFEACVKAGKYVEPDSIEKVEPWSVGTYVVALKDKADDIKSWYKGGIAEFISTSCIKLLMDASIWKCDTEDEERGCVKWFATRKEAEEFSKTLIEVEDKSTQQKFIAGKWYKSDNGFYLKPHTIKGSISLPNADYICDQGKFNKASSGKDNLNDWELLTNISEIQQYLPDGHPDKIVENKPEFIKSFSLDDLLYAREKFNKPNIIQDYKIGEWIYTSEGCHGYGLHPHDENKLFKILDIKDGLNEIYLILDFKSNNNVFSGNPCVYTKHIRKATESEIERHLEYVMVGGKVAMQQNNHTLDGLYKIGIDPAHGNAIFDQRIVIKKLEKPENTTLLRKNKVKTLNSNIIPVQSISISLKTKLNKS